MALRRALVAATVALTACPAASHASDGGAFVPAQHRTIPPLDKHNGAMTVPLTLVTITAINDYGATSLQAFGDAVIGSQWFEAVAAPYGVPAAAASLHVMDQPPITSAMSSTDVVSYIQNVIGDAGPAPNGSTLYLLYIPDAGSLVNPSTSGYHTGFPSRTASLGDSYAAVERFLPEASETELQQLTQTASHEILEAVTDPPGGGWHVGPGPAQAWTASVWESVQFGSIEVGDPCENTRVEYGSGSSSYLYQRILDNGIALDGGDDPCIPLNPHPYFNVTVAQDWFQVSPGETVVIPFIGWSSAETASWLIYPEFDQSTAGFVPAADGGLDAGTELGTGNAAPCFPRPALNNGVSGTMTFQVPPGVAPGEWAVFRIYSFHEGSGRDGCLAPLDEDIHYWPVGVYVE